MKTSSCKAKGRRLQQLIAGLISWALDIPAGKDELIQSREMGQSGSDVKLIGLAAQLYPFSVECKNTENWSLPAAIEQAKENARKTGLGWQVFLSKNRFPPVVVMDANDWFKMYREVIRTRKQAPGLEIRRGR